MYVGELTEMQYGFSGKGIWEMLRLNSVALGSADYPESPHATQR